MKMDKLPKDFVLKKVLQKTAWHKDKNDVFMSLDKKLKDNNVIYKTMIVNSKVVKFSIRIKDIKEIIEAHAHTMENITNGWYENNN